MPYWDSPLCKAGNWKNCCACADCQYYTMQYWESQLCKAVLGTGRTGGFQGAKLGLHYAVLGNIPCSSGGLLCGKLGTAIWRTGGFHGAKLGLHYAVLGWSMVQCLGVSTVQSRVLNHAVLRVSNVQSWVLHHAVLGWSRVQCFTGDLHCAVLDTATCSAGLIHGAVLGTVHRKHSHIESTSGKIRLGFLCRDNSFCNSRFKE